MTFIKIQLGDDITFIDPNSVTAVYQAMYGSRICCGFTTFSSEENAEDLIQRIEDARKQEPRPRQNFYYRTVDRKPTKEDADYNGNIICSANLLEWYRTTPETLMCSFWAPMPKVEGKV